MRVLRGVCLGAGLLVCACAAPLAAAESNSHSTSFGRGVSAYLSGDIAAAESLFAEAIGADPQDPRPRYFRALCRLRAGHRIEARNDFLSAASLEARSRGSYPVGQSLERVQGSDRLVLEQYRWHASQFPADTRCNCASSTSQHAEIAMHTDAGALRQAVSVPLDRLVQPVGLTELQAALGEPPLAGETIISDQMHPAGTAAAGAASSQDPFADDPHSAAAGKIRSGKLMGIVGRALLQSAPMPTLEGLRDQIPGHSQPAANDAAPGADFELGAEAGEATVTDDPFSESSAPVADPAAESPDEQPAADSVDEDPFG